MQAIDVQLARRAEFLTNRLNELGFRKNGNPMVVDQAFELVAAEEGFRNQHALRDKLKNYPALYIPYELDEEFAKAVMVQHTIDEDDFNHAYEAWTHIVEEAAKRLGVQPVTHESEKAGEQAWINVINRMGWDDRSEILHLEGFLRERGLMGELAKYAERVAREEADMASEPNDTSDWSPSDAIIETLKKVGYSVTKSDFRRPYWSFEDYGSEDFDTEPAAWAAAWTDAQERTVQLLNAHREAWAVLPTADRLARVAKTLNPSSHERMRAAAERAYQEYVFDDHLSVASDGGWEWSSDSNLVVRTVFLQDDRTPDANSVRYRFTVEVTDGQAVNVSLTR